MARPQHCRQVGASPAVSLFQPAGTLGVQLEEIQLSLDEFEAIRLADREGLYQEQAAERMGVSRTTFGRILEAAHGKIARALSDGCALRIEGGPVHPVRGSRRRCLSCAHEWSVRARQAGAHACPECGSGEVSCCGCCPTHGHSGSDGPAIPHRQTEQHR